jgi:hypothetical protein
LVIVTHIFYKFFFFAPTVAEGGGLGLIQAAAEGALAQLGAAAAPGTQAREPNALRTHGIEDVGDGRLAERLARLRWRKVLLTVARTLAAKSLPADKVAFASITNQCMAAIVDCWRTEVEAGIADLAGIENRQESLRGGGWIFFLLLSSFVF